MDNIERLIRSYLEEVLEIKDEHILDRSTQDLCRITEQWWSNKNDESYDRANALEAAARVCEPGTTAAGVLAVARAFERYLKGTG